MKLWVSLATALFCICAHSQVLKCRDAYGSVTYSDQSCPANSVGSVVDPSSAKPARQATRSSRRRHVKNAGGADPCSMLRDQAQQTFAAFQEYTNLVRWRVALQSLENLANSCASDETCALIRTRVEQAQGRYSEDKTSVRGGELDSVTSLFANSCEADGSRRQAQTTVQSPSSGAELLRLPAGHQTRDSFGAIVNSESCYWTKDASGNDAVSAGCSR